MGGTMGAGVGAVSSVGRNACFPAGTPVLMADGTTRPIEDVAVGDHVACTDPDTGQPTTSTVTRTFTHEHTPTIRIRTSNGDLETTPAHPLYVHGKGFTPAGHIQPGDRLRDNHGHPVTVHTVTATGQAPTVHNIEVNKHPHLPHHHNHRHPHPGPQRMHRPHPGRRESAVLTVGGDEPTAAPRRGKRPSRCGSP